MKLHEIKIDYKFALQKANGIKDFEIRKNDREYEIGDLIKYKVVNIPDCVESYFKKGKKGKIDKLYRANESINANIIKAKSIEKNLYQIVNTCDYEQKDEFIVWQEKIIYSKENNY